jgi:hypothetical protein
MTSLQKASFAVFAYSTIAGSAGAAIIGFLTISFPLDIALGLGVALGLFTALGTLLVERRNLNAKAL